MVKETIFLIIEYSGIPVALVLYSFVVRQLAIADPLNNNRPTESVWHYGLELMLVTAVSTLLFGLSFFGHTNGEMLSSEKKDCVIVALLVSIIEFAVLTFTVLKVRLWGRDNQKTTVYPNLIAGGFLAILIALIIWCTNYTHKMVPGTNHITQNEKFLSTKTWITLIIIGGILFVIIAIALIKYFVRKIKINAISDYNKGSRIVKSSPELGIKQLQDSLKKTPDDSRLKLDIHMKLSGVYAALGQHEQALKEIETLEQTAIYKSLTPYLRDAILNRKCAILLKLMKLPEAEEVINNIESDQLRNKLIAEIHRLKATGQAVK